MDPNHIYQNFTHDATGTTELQVAQQAAKSLGSEYENDALAVQKLADTVATGWTGRAADEAVQALAPLAVNLYQGSAELATTQDLISRQIASFHAAANKVQPVPPPPTLQDPTMMIMAGLDPTTMVDQQRTYLTAVTNNVDAMNNYQEASAYNTTNLPPMDPELQSVNVSVATSNSTGGRPGVTGSTQRAAPRIGGASSTRPAGSAANSTTAAPASAAGSRSASGTESAPGPAGSPEAISGGSGGGNLVVPMASGASSATTSSGSAAESAVGPVAPTTAVSLNSQDFGPAGAGARSFVRFGPVGGAGLLGSGGESENGAAARGPGATAGDGNGTGRIGGPSAAVTEGEAALGEATAARGENVGLPANALGRGGRDHQDGEHRRKYPYGENATELFLAGLPKVAPPVVGEVKVDGQELRPPENHE